VEINRTWPRCSNVHRWPTGSNNNNHSGCRGCNRSATIVIYNINNVYTVLLINLMLF
jgi:hypothetical protein